MNLKINEIANVINGVGIPHIYITSICTDSRNIKKGCLFVPIKGEKFDGHDYINEAIQKGAVCVLSEKKLKDIPYIYVNSTKDALLSIAGYYLRINNIKTIAITGSTGKTTTKDMLASVLSQRYKTKKTMGNFNNDIGMPLSIFNIEPGDEVIVLEMGMNHAGEIHRLSKAAEPDIAIITMIGDAHIDNFENQEGILYAKLEILDGLKPNGTIILNGDDMFLTSDIANKKTETFNTIYTSKKSIINKKSLGLGGTDCKININNKEIDIYIPIPGEHMIQNALLVIACALELGITPEEIKKGFDELQPAGNRLGIIKTSDFTIINDAYNASPSSMKEGLKVLAANGHGKKIAILGDMLGMGHVSEEKHMEVGEFAKACDIDFLICIGFNSKYIYNGFNNKHKSLHFKDIDLFLQEYKKYITKGCTVLVKASRDMEFVRIIEEVVMYGNC